MAGGIARISIVLVGFAAGAVLTYFWDPRVGKRRRHYVIEKSGHGLRETRKAIGGSFADVAHRSHGVLSKLQASIQREAVTDKLIIERIRAKIGHITKGTHSIGVDSKNGTVELSGPVRLSDVERVMSAARSVRGVRYIINRLEAGEIFAA